MSTYVCRMHLGRVFASLARKLRRSGVASQINLGILVLAAAACGMPAGMTREHSRLANLPFGLWVNKAKIGILISLAQTESFMLVSCSSQETAHVGTHSFPGAAHNCCMRRLYSVCAPSGCVHIDAEFTGSRVR